LIALLYALNILAGLFLVAVVLLQSGKGADMGAAFGGANSAVFGPSGPGNALTKITAATAALFMITALSLSVISSRENSVFDGMAEPTPIGGTPSPVAAPTPASPSDDAAQAASTPPSFEDQVKQAAQKAIDGASGTGVAAGDADKTADDATQGAAEGSASAKAAVNQASDDAKKAADDSGDAAGQAADSAAAAAMRKADETAGDAKQVTGVDSAAQAPAADTDAAKKAATGAVDGVTE
jgi:preprotein translocase subunit SecG